MGNRKREKSCWLICLILISMASSGCGKVGFANNSDDSSADKKECPAGQPDCGGLTSGFQTKLVEVPVETSAVDILFVIDNSASMTVELQQLGEKFRNLSEAMRNKDWQACLATTDWENEHGALHSWSDGSYVLGANTVDFASVFKNSMSAILQQNSNSATNIEQGIITAHQIFSNFGLAANKGCLREGSKKAVIFVSDEDELSNGWDPAYPLYTPRRDNKPQTFLDLIVSKFGADSGFTAHSIGILPGDEKCLDQQRRELGFYLSAMGYYAIRYGEIVQATKGEAVSICDQDYSGPLARIGSRIANSLGQLDLPCSSGVTVAKVLAGLSVLIEHSFSVQGNSVVFSPALGAGEKAQILYRCN